MGGVVKSQLQSADRLETQTLPKFYGPLIGAHDEVELHRPKTSAARIFERMLAHSAPNAAPCRVACCDVAAVRHMVTAAELIRAKIISAEQAAILLGDECLMIQPHPICDRFGLGHVPGQRIGLAGADHRLKDAPDGVMVFRSGGSDE
jgi:hypothetical protein